MADPSSQLGEGFADDAEPGQHAGATLISLPLTAWPQIARCLTAFELVRLSVASSGLRGLLNSIPGLWQQACDRHVGQALELASKGSSGGTNCSLSGTCGQTAQQQHEPPLQQEQQQQLQQPHTQFAAWRCPSDAAGAAILSALCQLQHTCKQQRLLLRPMMFTPPPWLPSTVGKARGYVPVTAGGTGLSPPLLLTAPEAYWLHLGCPVEHINGVFASSCSASPRTCAPCSAAALVVVHKQLVAEVYLRQQPVAPCPWSALAAASSTTPVAPRMLGQQLASPAYSSEQQEGVGGAAVSVGDGYVPVELWFHHSVLQQAPGHSGAAGRASAGNQGTGRGPAAAPVSRPLRAVSAGLPGTRVPVVAAAAAAASSANTAMPAAAGGGGGGGGTPGVTPALPSASTSEAWQQVHQMVQGCILSNVTRARAMTGTAIVLPATPACQEVVTALQQLQQAGFPMCDLRVCLQEALRQVHATTRPELVADTPVLQQQQQQQSCGMPGSQQAAAAEGAASDSSSSSTAGDAGGAAAAWRFLHQNITQGMCSALQQHLQGQASSQEATAAADIDGPDYTDSIISSSSSSSTMNCVDSSGSGGSYTTIQGSSSSSSSRNQDSSSSSSTMPHINSDFLGELLKVVVQRLPRLAPTCQLLVLPLLLPASLAGPYGPGRHLRQVPGKSSYSSGAAFSGPKLLNLNVPFLMPLRELWEGLPHLQQVVLVVSPELTRKPSPSSSGSSRGSTCASPISSTVADALRSMVASCLDRLGPTGDSDSWEAG